MPKYKSFRGYGSTSRYTAYNKSKPKAKAMVVAKGPIRITKGKVLSGVKGRTPVRTTTRSRNRLIKSPPGGTLSHSYTKAGQPSKSKFTKLMKPLSGLQTITVQAANKFTGTTGEQYVFETGVSPITNDMNSWLSTIQQIDAAEFVFTPSDRNLSELLLSLEGTKIDYFMTNASDFPVHVTILDLVAKKDVPDASVGASTYFSPQSTWERGIAQQQKGDAAAPVQGQFREFLFQSPTRSIEFNKYWKIVGRRYVEMAAGRSHRHVFNWRGGRVLTKDEIHGAMTANTVGYWRGITCDTLILYNGVPVAGPEGVATTSAAEVIYRTCYTYAFRGMHRTAKFTQQNGFLANITVAQQTRQATEIVEDEDTP